MQLIALYGEQCHPIPQIPPNGRFKKIKIKTPYNVFPSPLCYQDLELYFIIHD